MANVAGGVAKSRQNMSNSDREIRQEIENEVVVNDTKPKMNELVKSRPEMKVVFNKLLELNDYYTEGDSIPLNSLVLNLYLRTQNEQVLLSMDIEDEEYERYLLRTEKFDKKVNEAMKQLSIPLRERYSLSNEIAKTMIEEKKLEQMNNENTQERNPLLDVLDRIEEMNS